MQPVLKTDEYLDWCLQVELSTRFNERYGGKYTAENIERFIELVRWMLEREANDRRQDADNA